MHPELMQFLKGDRVIADEVWGDQLDKVWMFPAERDETKPLPRDTSQKLWQAIARAADIPRGEQYGWHSFRRAFANRLHRAGVAIRDAQDLGGWKNPKVYSTRTYCPTKMHSGKRWRRLPACNQRTVITDSSFAEGAGPGLVKPLYVANLPRCWTGGRVV